MSPTPARRFRRVAAYGAVALLVSAWWMLSFYTHTPSTKKLAYNAPATFSFSRDDLRAALNGDIAQMSALVNEWGADTVLAPEKADEFQTLVQLLLKGSDSEIVAERTRRRPSSVVDHWDDTHALTVQARRFLPQTYLSSSIMLSVADADQIVALPHGIRSHDHIYSAQRMAAIALDTDRLNAEAVYRARPDIAFVAHYSNPATIETLRSQGVALFGINKIDTLPEVLEVVELVSTTVDRPLKGRVLRLFAEAAMNAIDGEVTSAPDLRVLYLNYYPPFSTPTSRTLTAQMLERLGCRSALSDARSSGGWRVVLSQEEIRHLNPDCIIVSCSDFKALKRRLSKVPGVASVAAARRGNIFFVDEATQQCPCHHVVLAYYDLASAVAGATDTSTR